MLIISIITYELEMTQCHQKSFNLIHKTHSLSKLCLFGLYSRNRHRSYGQSIVSQNSLVDKVLVLLCCVYVFSILWSCALSCSNINAYSRKNLFANLRILIRESMRNNYCVKRNWINKLFFLVLRWYQVFSIFPSCAISCLNINIM